MAICKGVYRISRWPGTQEIPDILSITDEGDVTIAPPNVQPSKNQEWFVEILENGNVAIQHPPNRWPSRSLSYEKPEAGDRIVLGPVSDFPTREWRVEPAPQLPLPVPYFIRVPDKELIVVPSNIFIEPPQLKLGLAKGGLEYAWAFELLRAA